MYRMTTVASGLFILLLLALPAAADNWSDCLSFHTDLSIKGCTTIIKVKGESKHGLAVAYFNRGDAYSYKGDLDRAIADYDQAINLEPTYALVYSKRGNAYSYKGDLDRAIADYDKAISLDPKLGDAYYGRGKTYDKRGRTELALADLRQAFGLIPYSDTKHEGAMARIAALEQKLAAARQQNSAEMAAAEAPANKEAVAVEAAFTGKRVALVIGNSAYQYVHHLPNPVNDAADFAAALQRIGFTVHKETDLDFNGMRKALRDFGDEAAGADVAAIFFAGHGLEMDKQNYLVPVDAQLRTDRDVPLEAISLDYLLSAVEGAKSLRLVFLDACRTDPFTARMKMTVASRSIGRGLSRVDPPGGILVSFSAKDGTEALDGDSRNSPYTTALLAHLQEPGTEIRLLLGEVHDQVMAATGNKQEPFTYGALGGKAVYLVPPAGKPRQPAPEAKLDAVAQVWAVTQNSSSVEVLRAFIERFKGTVYADLAAARLKEIEQTPQVSTRQEATVSTNGESNAKAEVTAKQQAALLPPPQPSSFAAFAVVLRHGAKFHGYGRGTTAVRAKNGALKACGNFRCKIVQQYHHGQCANVVLGTEQVWWNDTDFSEASWANILNYCAGHDKGCKVIVSECLQ